MISGGEGEDELFFFILPYFVFLCCTVHMYLHVHISPPVVVVVCGSGANQAPNLAAAAPVISTNRFPLSLISLSLLS